MRQAQIINLDKIQLLSTIPARRALLLYQWGKLGLESAKLEDVVLKSGLWSAQVLPLECEEGKLDQLKLDYVDLLMLSSLRELIEYTGYFLDELYLAAYTLVVNCSEAIPKATPESFKGELSVSDKIKKLRKVGIECPDPDFLRNLDRIRAAYTHHASVATRRALKDQNKLVLKWKAFVSSVGDQSSRMSTETKGIPFEKGQEISVGLREYKKEFLVNEPIGFEDHEYNEICYYAAIVLQDYKNNFGEFIKARERASVEV